MLGRLLLSFALLLSACPVRAFDNLDYGNPGETDQVVERDGYSLGYVNAWRQPAWVSYRLTAWEAQGAVSRSDDFREDPAIPAECRATLADYSGSGYDRGHLSPAADNAWSFQSMRDSFYLSNMSPQTPSLNRGLWSRIEAAVRNFAIYEDGVVVVTGPIVTNGVHATIGANRVLVPDGYYKVVYAENYAKMIGFLVWQDSSGAVTNFVCSVDDIERLTGLDFFGLLDDAEEELMEAACFPDNWFWEQSAREDTEDVEWEDYAVDPVEPILLSGMGRSWGARSWSLDLAALTNVYPKTTSGNCSPWENGVTVPGLQAYVDGVAVTNVTRNHGKETGFGFYVFWETNKVVGAYSFGTMTADKKGRQTFGVVFRNDLRVDVEAVDVEYVGRQFGFRNKVEQTLVCELLATNALLAVCNGVGWTAPEGLSFTTPVVGNPDNLVHGESAPATNLCRVVHRPVRIHPGEYLHLRWSRESIANSAALGIDGLKVRFSTGGGCIVIR